MAIRGEERRAKIIEILTNATSAVKGSELAEKFGVSRQVIVNDISILRASHPDLMAVKAGYLLLKNAENRRVFKVKHTDEETEDELTLIVNLGGTVLDVFVEHKVYGTISAPLNIASVRDVKNFIADMKSGVSTPLKNITHGYHYHTVKARSEAILNEIEATLKEKGYLIEVLSKTNIYTPKDYSES